jgi:diaminopimelate decarboxylase
VNTNPEHAPPTPQPKRAQSAPARSAGPVKPRILGDELLRELAARHGTPLYVYAADIVRERIASLRGFDVVRYAQKANSNLAILEIVRAAGAKIDAVSAGEIARGFAAGFTAGDIVFTADLFDRAALDALATHDVPVNLGSPFMVEQYARLRPGHAVTLRVNPGFGHGHAQKVNTGGETSKHGIWHEQLEAVVANAHRHGLTVRGLHVHIGSGSDFEHLTHVCGAMRKLAPLAGPHLESISAGGGLPIPYHATDSRFDVARFSDVWLETRAAIESDLGRKISIEVEPGRYLVAEAGCLLTEVRGIKTSGAFTYILVDAGFHNLMRPALYGAFHQISVVGRDATARSSPKVVAGPLCESADVFTQDADGELTPQMLPDVLEGDLVCIHDAGAYGQSMASTYNSQPLCTEILVDGAEARIVHARLSLEDDLEDPSRLDVELLREGSVVNYRDEALLARDLHALTSLGYRSIELRAVRWRSPVDFHRDVSASLDLGPDYAEDLAALKTGVEGLRDRRLALCVHDFDVFAKNHPVFAAQVIAVLDSAARRHLLFGRRMMTLLFSADPAGLLVGPAGATPRLRERSDVKPA